MLTARRFSLCLHRTCTVRTSPSFDISTLSTSPRGHLLRGESSSMTSTDLCLSGSPWRSSIRFSSEAVEKTREWSVIHDFLGFSEDREELFVVQQSIANEMTQNLFYRPDKTLSDSTNVRSVQKVKTPLDRFNQQFVLQSFPVDMFDLQRQLLFCRNKILALEQPVRAVPTGLL